MMLARARPLLLPFVAALSISCSSPRTAFDEKLANGDFAFVMAWGSGWHGFSVLRVSASGESTYLYGEEDNRWLIPFTISREQVGALGAELDRVGYWSLPPKFSSGAADGTQWFVKARAANKRHAVYLDNEFPPAIEQLSDFVRRKIVSQALAQKSEAEPVEYDDWKEVEPHGADDTP